MNFRNPYLSKIEKANLLQRWIIVHSILYYVMDESFIEDRVYDANSRQLVRLLNSMTDREKRKTRYWYAFKDFDGSTGFHLHDRLKKEDKIFLRREANIALSLSKMNFKSYI